MSIAGRIEPIGCVVEWVHDDGDTDWHEYPVVLPAVPRRGDRVRLPVVEGVVEGVTWRTDAPPLVRLRDVVLAAPAPAPTRADLVIGDADRLAARALLDEAGLLDSPPDYDATVLELVGEAVATHRDRVATLTDEIARWRATAAEAAREIESRWHAHTDDEGYGPVALVRRLRERPAHYAHVEHRLDLAPFVEALASGTGDPVWRARVDALLGEVQATRADVDRLASLVAALTVGRRP